MKPLELEMDDTMGPLSLLTDLTFEFYSFIYWMRF